MSPHPLLFYPVILVSKWRNMPFAWVKSKRPFTVWSKHKLELFHQKMVIHLLSGTFKAMGDGWLFCPKACMNVQDTPNKRTVKRFTQYLHFSCGGWQFNWVEEIQRLKIVFDFSLKKINIANQYSAFYLIINIATQCTHKCSPPRFINLTFYKYERGL